MKRVTKLIAFILAFIMLLTVYTYAGTAQTAMDYYKLGIAAMNDGKYDDAVKNFDLGLKLDSKNNDLYYQKAKALNYQDKYEEALTCIQTAIDMKPEILANYGVKGSSLHNLGKNQEAIEAFKKALEEISISYDVYLDMAHAYLELNDTDSCIKTLKMGVSRLKFFKTLVKQQACFSSLAGNPAYDELMSDCRDDMALKNFETDILNDSIFENVVFAEAQNSDPQTQEITAAKDKYLNNVANGLIYNEQTAISNGLSSQSPFKKFFINSARAIKKILLIGFKGTYSTNASNVMYIGKSNGELKAAIIHEKGIIDMGAYSRDHEYYLLFVKNNGAWELYGMVDPME